MFLTNDRKQSRITAEGAKPRWDNSEQCDAASTKLFILAVVHGAIMIGIGWAIVRFMMKG